MSKFYQHIAGEGNSAVHLTGWTINFVMLLLLVGCTAPRAAQQDTITVSGIVTVRGNEPFTELVLQTEDRNYYVLKFSNPEERGQVQNMSPASLEITGDVYRDIWGSRAFAHLRVDAWQSVP